METIAETAKYQYGPPKYAGQTMTKAEFLRWESDDNYAYEFNDGMLDPTTGMRQDEGYLLTNLETRFFTTAAFQQGVRLRTEMDVWVTERQMRRPDVSFFTNKQLRLMKDHERVVPGFMVEFGSVTDNEVTTIIKRHEYFAAGVQVLWWVYPTYREVYVYTSPKTVTICTDDDVLTAAPALPDFELTVTELFRQ